MMAVGLSEEATAEFIATVEPEAASFGINIACINSPDNVTVSGEERLVDQLKMRLEAQNVFARKLRVSLAYHSRQMRAISIKYTSLVETLTGPPDDMRGSIPMISTVSGERVDAKQLLDTNYWALNMESPVKFSQAISTMCAQSRTALVKKIDRSHLNISIVDYLLEIGPHAALQGPIREILRSVPRGASIGYTSVLKRGQSATETLLRAVGELHSSGVNINFGGANHPEGHLAEQCLLVDLPEYPFDHSQRYWYESRLSRNYRLRSHAPSELLGVRSRDWNPAEPRWRHFIRRAEMPWVEQHVIQGRILYPAAGMLVMALEAVKQLTGAMGTIEGYTLRDVHIEAPMDLTNNSNLEAETSLRQTTRTTDGQTFEFTIRSIATDEWLVNCRGYISVQFARTIANWEDRLSQAQRQSMSKDIAQLCSSCETAVDSQRMYGFLQRYGFDYGIDFRAATHQRCDSRENRATAQVALFRSTDEPHVIHPVSLDAILHIFLTALSSGGSKSTDLNVPYRIGSMWLSNRNLSWPESETVEAFTAITQITNRGCICEGAALDTGHPAELKLWYRDFEMRTVAKDSYVFHLPNPEQFCMNVECKVALDMMGLDETTSWLNSIHPQGCETSGFYESLDLLVELSLRRLASKTFSGAVDGLESWVDRYLSWARHHLATRPPLQGQDLELQFQSLCDNLKDANHVGSLYVEVARNLSELLSGKLKPLELLMQSGLLANYYDQISNYRGAKQAASYLDLLAHQRPGMDILEVGGGTASATRNFIRILHSNRADRPGSLRCKRYDFTDVSSSFLEKAREEFPIFEAQMSFSTLDVNGDLEQQGFRKAAYDVVVADNVLHVSSDVAETIRQVRNVLKPGGKLIIHEPSKPDGWPYGFVFGLFPGWWQGSAGNNRLSPSLHKDQWDTLLRESGFSGVDYTFRDFENDTAHHSGWMISTAATAGQRDIPRTQRQKVPWEALVFIKPDVTEQLSLAESLLSTLQDVFQIQPRILSIDSVNEATARAEHDSLVVLLTDYGSSWLNSVNERDWAHLKQLVGNWRRLLWVTAGGGHNTSPEHAVLDGLARTLRSEDSRLHLVTVALQPHNTNAHNVKHLTRIMKTMITRPAGQAYEQDFIEIDTKLHTRRLVDADYLRNDVYERLVDYDTVDVRSREDLDFEVCTVGSPEQDGGTPFYVECPRLSEENMGPDTVDIDVKAVSLMSRDRDCALGLVVSPNYGSYCAGTIARGPRVEPEDPTDVRPGDRVFAACLGSFRSHVRAPTAAVVRLPPEVSLTYACRVLPLYVTAYHALIERGHINTRQSVLVHNGASAVGEVALRLLAERGVVGLWTTVSKEEERNWIQQNLGLPLERILPTGWFENQNISLASYTKKFDVVFQPIGESLQTTLLSLDCVASGGQYIVLENGSGVSDPRQIHGSRHDVSLIFVLPPEESTRSPDGVSRVTQESLRYAASSAQATVHESTRHRMSHFPATDLVQSFETLRRMDQGDVVVVTLDRQTDLIYASLTPSAMHTSRRLTSTTG